MAQVSLNNGLGFPRLTSNPAGMYMFMPQTPADEPKKDIQKNTVSKDSSGSKKMTDKTKYMLGASSVAASVVAGILIARSSRFKKEKITDPTKSYLENLRLSFDTKNKIENIYEDGHKRIDELLRPAGIGFSKFLDKDNKEVATVYWDLLNNVASYKILDENGSIIKEF